jgi:hypothetical protein
MDIMDSGRIGPPGNEGWVGVELGPETDESGAVVDDRPVFKTEKIKGVLLYPYRYVRARSPKLYSSARLTIIITHLNYI